MGTMPVNKKSDVQRVYIKQLYTRILHKTFDVHSYFSTINGTIMTAFSDKEITITVNSCIS